MTLGSSPKTSKEAQDWEKQKRTCGWEAEHAASSHGPFSEVRDSNSPSSVADISVFVCQNW